MRLVTYDCEVFVYDWLVTLKDKETGPRTRIWNDNEALKMALSDDYIYVGFNSKHYDQFIVKAIAADFTPQEIKKLSPIYTTSARGGCWFCHFQSIGQLRILKNNYPDLWRLLLKWDLDSPFTFKSDGHTVHDYDARFLAEEQGLVPTDKRFRWKMLKDTEPNKEDKTCEIRR